MSPRILHVFVVIICFSSLILFSSADDNRMNVLFIVTDDLRPDVAGIYGDSRVFTPNIDRLMQSGVTFTRAYTQCPICSPSRTSFVFLFNMVFTLNYSLYDFVPGFLTGLRPDTTRVRSHVQGHDAHQLVPQ